MSELRQRLLDEADLCANDGADDIASLLNEAANALSASPPDLVCRSPMAEPDIAKRLRKYEGRSWDTDFHTRGRRLTNPCMTAREAYALAAYIADLRDSASPQQSDAYVAANPLGGPAKLFDAVADEIRAGESVEAAMRHFGLTWEPPEKLSNEPATTREEKP